MERTSETSLSNGGHDLSKAEPFVLGPLSVDPPARRVGIGVRSEMLEPRVMRVLVALGETPGRVLSRDHLIELCWDGQIVSDKAITRATSLLRHAIEDLSGGTVRLETIPRVGFRLAVAGQPDARQTPVAGPPVAKAVTGARFRWSRREMGAGLVAAGGTALAVAVWLRTRQHVPDPRAVELYRHGQAIQKDGVLETMGEAIKAYKQAVAIDPRYADAWGALALSYRYPVVGPFVRLGDPQEVRAPARRALALDPGNADARLALITLYPYYRRWQEYEAQLRAFLRDYPDSALGHFRLGQLLLNLGRIEDAVTEANQAIDIDPTRQIAWLYLAYAYYYAGRDDEGDVAIEEARSRWPQAWRLYVNGYYLLLFGKRYSEALAYARDTNRRPRMLGPEIVERYIQQADAFASGRSLAELKKKSRIVFQPASLKIQAPQFAGPGLALLGMVDEMFTFLEAYFLGGVVNGTRVAPPGPLDPRSSYPLFAPAVLSLRSDPRFTSLLARTGLEDYWHKTGIQPDFRRS
jgi:DNA-binding winged helix-turn-helix (wHTH) protein/tetratricopeptide (TPR) repeat protein